jgi:hypothetical protein
MTSAEEAWVWVQPALQEVRANTGAAWEQRRARFLELLGLADPDQHPAAAALFRQLDDMPESDRTSLLDSDGLDTWVHDTLRENLPDTETAADGQTADAYDESAWAAYLATNGPSWDGTEESWAAFREWFAYHAEEQGLSSPATALLDHLDAQSAPDRIATLATYGVAIGQDDSSDDGGFGWVTENQRTVLTGRWGEDWPEHLTTDLDARWEAGWQANPAEHKAAWLSEVIASGAFTAEAPADAEGGAAGGEADDAYLAELAETIRQVPGYDQLSQEELAEAIAAAVQ